MKTLSQPAQFALGALTATGLLFGFGIYQAGGSAQYNDTEVTVLQRVEALLGNGVIASGGNGAFTGSFNGTHTGNGTGLTNLSASNLTTGTLPDARLSGNVIKKTDAQPTLNLLRLPTYNIQFGPIGSGQDYTEYSFQTEFGTLNQTGVGYEQGLVWGRGGVGYNSTDPENMGWQYIDDAIKVHYISVAHDETTGVDGAMYFGAYQTYTGADTGSKSEWSMRLTSWNLTIQTRLDVTGDVTFQGKSHIQGGTSHHVNSVAGGGNITDTMSFARITSTGNVTVFNGVSGDRITVKNKSGGAVTLLSADTFDGNATLTLNNNEAVSLTSTGTDWMVY